MASLLKTLFLTVLISLSSYSQVPQSHAAAQNAEAICPLLIGEDIPNASLVNTSGDEVEMHQLFKSKPTVLVFYRGGWCPYCNKQLSGLVAVEKDILALGYQIIAVSPDHYQNLKPTQDKNEIAYQLLSDPEAKFIQQIGIGFKTPSSLFSFIESQKPKGKTSEILPVPTVMIVNKSATILFEYINPNYKERISGEMLLAVLKTLKI